MRELITRSWTTDWIGMFPGAVYELEDGSKWEVTDTRSGNAIGFRKKVTVTRNGRKYRMKPEGDRKAYLVKPLALPDRKPVPFPTSQKDQLMSCLITDLLGEIAKGHR